MKRCFPCLLFLLGGFGLFGPSPRLAAGSEPLSANENLRLARGLTERRLFQSVEILVSQTLSETTGLDEQAALLAEQLRARGLYASTLPFPERRAALERWTTLEKEARNRFADRSEQYRIDLEGVISRNVLGDLFYLEAVILPETERATAMEQARALLNEVVATAEEVRVKLEKSRSAAGNDSSGQHLRDTLMLEESFLYQEAIAYRALAMTFEESSIDREHSLQRSKEYLERLAGFSLRHPSHPLFAEHPHVAESTIALAGCHRLLGDFTSASQVLGRLAKQDEEAPEPRPLTPMQRWAISTERLRLFLAQNDPESAASLAASVPLEAGVPPDYALARLELLTALWKREPNEKRLAEAVRFSNQLGERSGPYWGRRARLLLGAAARETGEAVTGHAPTLALNVELATEALRRGDDEEAMRQYVLATEIARNGGDAEEAMHYAATAAALLDRRAESLEGREKTRRLGRALEILRTTALALATPESAELHLQAIDLAARLAPHDAEEAALYLVLLQEHVDHWPASPKRAALLLRAARILQTQGRHREALERLAVIPTGSPAESELLVRARIAFETLERELPGASSATPFEGEAAEWFQRRIPVVDPALSDFSAEKAFCQASFLAAEYRIKQGSVESCAEAEKILRSVENRLAAQAKQGAGKDQEKAEAASARLLTRTLLIFALAGQGREAETLPIVMEIEQAARRLSPVEQAGLARIKAQALARVGRLQEAMEHYAALLKARPDDPAVLRPFAVLLSERREPEALVLAVTMWERLESVSPRNSELWWAAKEGMIDVLIRQGEIDEAGKRIELLRKLYPKLGGEERRQRLLERQTRLTASP